MSVGTGSEPTGTRGARLRVVSNVAEKQEQDTLFCHRSRLQVAGRSDALTYLRDSGEGPRVRKKDVVEAVDKSLKRLDTDYIDLLQVRACVR